MHPISKLTLVYRGDSGDLYITQPGADIMYSGTLIDPDTGDDMELIGFYIEGETD